MSVVHIGAHSARAPFALLAACLAFLVGCGDDAPPKSDAPAVLVVFVDGVAGAVDAQLWAEELGPGASTGSMIGVSTSLTASFVSALTGLEPPEHGTFSATEYRAVVTARAPFENEQPWHGGPGPLVVSYGATTVRELSGGPDVLYGAPTALVGSRDLGHVFDALAAEAVDVQDRMGVSSETLAEARTLETIAVRRPRPGAPWPQGLADELERSVRPLLEADGRPIPETLDGWYERVVFAHYEAALERAFHRAWSRALAREVSERAESLDAVHTDWTVIVAGLRTDAMARGVVDLSERLPYCALSSARAPAAPTELRDLAYVVAAALGVEARAPERSPSDGLWRGSELVGTRDRWSMVERETEGGGTIGLLDPPASGLVLELATDAEPVDVLLVAHVDDVLIAADLGATVRRPERQGKRFELHLEPGERIVVHTRRRAPDLLMEFVRDGAAADPATLFVGAYPLGRTQIPRVLDAGGPKLDETELATRVRVTTGPAGLVRLEGRGDRERANLYRWPPLERPLQDEECTRTGFEVRLPGPGRIAVCVSREGLPEALADEWDGLDAWYEAHELALDGHVPAGDALRLIWPAMYMRSLESPPPVPAGALRLSALGPFLSDAPSDPDLRAFLSTLGDHE
ncbi:hypothetical protein Pla163_06780 [Planctomycetes bacterium Pla163]|uniref:Sulfatase N-terminal domain-containing protein n=1 Tax=Rohdeia mirabilis TaxID=2528008 RepID=A0A518CWI4_9BACT|nr:hypothetical protein Pla163_06780 [Planctomycetes bacterium Pla163]